MRHAIELAFVVLMASLAVGVTAWFLWSESDGTGW